MITSLRGDLAQQRRVRARMPSPAAVAAAAAARAAGDWRASAAAVGADVHVDLAAVRDRHGADAAARIEDDLRHLALDLLCWHLPRHQGGRTTFKARTSALLAPAGPDAPLIQVRLPLSPTGPQRLRLSVATTADLEDHRWYVAPRHTWDVRATAGLRAAWGCSDDRPPLLTPGGEPLPWDALGRGDDPAAATERVYLMLAAGEFAAAWRTCGIDLKFTDTKALQRESGPPTCPVGLADEIRAVAAVFQADRVATQFGAYVDVTVGESLTATASDAFEYFTVEPRVASSPVPTDLALLHAGPLTLDALHPLLRAALFPSGEGRASSHRSTGTRPFPSPEASGRARRGRPGASGVGDPARVRCRGRWHTLSVRDGQLRLHDHDEDELRREQMARTLGAPDAGCFAARDIWLTGPGPLPRDLVAQRIQVRERMLDGDTDWLLDGLERGVIDPLMRDRSGWSLRHMAMWVDHARLLPLLDAAGLPVDVPDRIGRTPLYAAVMNGGGVDYIKALLAAGADPFAETVHGASAAGVAGDHARRDDVRFLDDLWRERCGLPVRTP